MRPLRDARASREAISLRTLLRAQSLRGHNGTAGPPPNLRWTIFGGIRDVRLRVIYQSLVAKFSLTVFGRRG